MLVGVVGLNLAMSGPLPTSPDAGDAGPPVGVEPLGMAASHIRSDEPSAGQPDRSDVRHHISTREVGGTATGDGSPAGDDAESTGPLGAASDCCRASTDETERSAGSAQASTGGPPSAGDRDAGVAESTNGSSTPAGAETGRSTDTALINVREHGAAGDGITDDTQAIQTVLDNADPGAVVYFPPAPGGRYLLSETLRIDKPLTLAGDGRTTASEIHQSSIGSALTVSSSDVTVKNLRLVGRGYGPYTNASAIYIDGQDEARIANISALDNHIEGWGGSAIRWGHVSDFVIRGNHITGATYAGVLIISGFRGLIAENTVEDAGQPLTGSPLETAYLIVVTSIPGSPYSREVIIRNNHARTSPIWTGIHNHGGDRILIDSNQVDQTMVAYANTRVAGTGRPSNEVLFINNVGRQATSNSMWLTGEDSAPSEHGHAIGNRFEQSGPIKVYSQAGGTVTWNSVTSSPGGQGAIVLQRKNLNMKVLNNQATTVDESTRTSHATPDEPPPTPSDFVARELGADVHLTWTFDRVHPHDSFYIERQQADGAWAPVAYRPPNDGRWDFSSRNPNWETLDPLAYTVQRAHLGESFRIRAQHGGAASEWAYTTDQADG